MKTAEKISLKINPPKPERESNRRRKKKSLDDDFIDISDPTSLYLYDWDQKKSQGARKQVKKKDPVPPERTQQEEEKELEQIMKNHQQSFSYNSQRRTVSPLRLSLNPLNKRSMSIEEAPEDVQSPDDDHHHDLTNRDSVRQLMVKKKNGDTDNLNSALVDAMNDFGGADADDDDLVIDESPRHRKKKPLKLRLSVGSISDYNSENGSASPFYSPSTRDAVAGQYKVQKLKYLFNVMNYRNVVNISRREVASQTCCQSFPQAEEGGRQSAAEDGGGREDEQSAPGRGLHLPRTRSVRTGSCHNKLLREWGGESLIWPDQPTLCIEGRKIFCQSESSREERLFILLFNPMKFILFLEASDDEEIPLQKDDAWNPKIKMSTVSAKVERPIRDSAKNVAIEKGLKIASEKQKTFIKIKSSGKVHKQLKPKVSKPLDIAEFSNDRSRPRKVGNTAKQRLGKILKLKF